MGGITGYAVGRHFQSKDVEPYLRENAPVYDLLQNLLAAEKAAEVAAKKPEAAKPAADAVAKKTMPRIFKDAVEAIKAKPVGSTEPKKNADATV